MRKKAKVLLAIILFVRLLTHPAEHALAQLLPSPDALTHGSEVNSQAESTDQCALCQASHSFSTLCNLYLPLPIADPVGRLEQLIPGPPSWILVADRSPRGPPRS